MLGALIGAGASILGSVLNKNAQDKGTKMNIAAQREFAQQGIRWKVEDAKAAGLHPLAAIGAQTSSFSPVAVGDYGSGIGQAGQDIGRAIDSTRTYSEKQGANEVLGRLAIERAGLENNILRQQLVNSKYATINQAGGTPATPGINQRSAVGPSQGDAVKITPQEITATDPRIGPGQTPAPVQDITWSLHPNGRYYPMPSKAAKELMEDNLVPQTMHSLRNYTPGTYIGEPFPAPPGQRWTGNRYTGYHLEHGGLAGLRRNRRAYKDY